MEQKANSSSQYSHRTILFGHSDLVCSCRSLFCIFPLQSSQVTSSYWHTTKCSCCKRKKRVLSCLMVTVSRKLSVWYPDNSRPGQFAPRSFTHHQAKRDVKFMKPRLSAIEIILRSFIHYRVWSSGASCLGRIVQGGQFSGIRLFPCCILVLKRETVLLKKENSKMPF